MGTPKSARSVRNVPLLDDALIADLRAHLMAHPNSGDPEALFWPGRAPSRAPGPKRLDYSRVLDMNSFARNYFKPALIAAELPPMRVHDLRHTAASLWLDDPKRKGKQRDILKVSRWLGHESTDLTTRVDGHLLRTNYEEERADWADYKLGELG